MIEETMRWIKELIELNEKTLKELKDLGLLLQRCDAGDELLIRLINYRVRGFNLLLR